MDHRAAKAYILARLRNELPAERTYHSLEHTLDVYASAIGIAEEEGVDGEDLVLLKTAALFHDCGFLVQGREHELAGCVIVREVLPAHGFGNGQVERICAMIMATRIPQTPEDHLSRILCDADLDYLGRSDFERIGMTLYNEFLAYGMVSDERKWNILQVGFLEKHRYFTETNKQLREPVKQEHLQRLRTWLEDHPE